MLAVLPEQQGPETLKWVEVHPGQVVNGEVVREQKLRKARILHGGKDTFNALFIHKTIFLSR